MRLLSLYALILLISILPACHSNEKEATPLQISAKWKLVKSRSAWTGQESTPASLGYDEYYEFKNDSTFRKYRSTGIEISGSYTTSGDTIRIYFAQETDNAKLILQSGCFNRSSSLRPDANNHLVENSMACDKPTSFYEKVKE